MRKLFLATAMAALTGATMATVAAERDTAGPEARAYLSYAFGGSKAAARNFHYGLRLDVQDRADVRPPLMDLGFNGRGEPLARINGLSVVRQVRLNQDEEGSDSGEVPTGDETTYSMVDWGLVAIGALGIGYVAYEALDNEESGAAAPPAEEEGGCFTDLPIDPVLDLVLDTVLGFEGDGGMLPTVQSQRNIEHHRWLDSGTGQMGDLGG